jgi:hypothetical protein
MTTAPASITIYDAERAYADDRLDFAYIDEVACEAAYYLEDATPTEVNYQPGDGTRYPLVIVPLRALFSAPPRVVDGTAWGRHAVDGMGHSPAVAAADYYDPTGYLVTWVGHASYPFRLGERGNVLAADYVDEHMGKPGAASAVSLAVLFRAISYHLDQQTWRN